jgi:hypothetical protein
MTVVVIVILVARQDAIMGFTNPMAVLIVMDGAEQSFPAAANLVTVLIIVIGIIRSAFS